MRRSVSKRHAAKHKRQASVETATAELDDVQKRLNGLATNLSTGAISQQVFDKLQQICAALAASDIQTALAIHVDITTTDWTENQSWLIGLKRLIEMITKQEGISRNH